MDITDAEAIAGAGLTGVAAVAFFLGQMSKSLTRAIADVKEHARQVSKNTKEIAYLNGKVGGTKSRHHVSSDAHERAQ